MERRKYLKLLAFVPAILLVGSLIAYQAGAFQQSAPPRVEPEPQSQPPSQPVETTQPTPASPPVADWMMYGSKSAKVMDAKQLEELMRKSNIPSVSSQPEPNSPSTEPPIFMGGSKYSAIFTPPKQAAPSPTVPPKP